MRPLIVELAPQEAIYKYADYRYWSVHIDEDELDGLLALLRVWVTENECHTFIINPARYDPPCETREQLWKQLLAHIHENRFIVHGEP